MRSRRDLAVGCLAMALPLESPKTGFGRLDDGEARCHSNAAVGYPSFLTTQ